MGLLDPPGLSKAVADATYAPTAVADAVAVRSVQRQPFATRSGAISSLNTLSNGTDLWANFSTRHVVQQAVSGLWVQFPNYYNNAGVETDGPNDITVKATILDPAGAYIPVWFNGRRSTVVEPGPGARSEFIPVPMKVGDVFHIRVLVTVASTGQKWPLNRLVLNTTEGVVRGTGAVSDLTGSGTITNVSERMYTPTVLGQPAAPFLIAVEGAGDSITDGIGDTSSAGGWFQRACETLGIPHAKIGTPSELANTFKQAKVRTRRTPATEGCRVTVIKYGINDFINSFTASQVKSSLVQGWRERATTGRLIVAGTVTPRTSSSDSWATLENQTSNLPASRETDRVEVNNWIRDGAPLNTSTLAPVAIGTSPALRIGDSGHPVSDFVDFADAAESARNSGKWRVDLGAPTTDGTHPSAVIHQAMSEAFQAKWPTIAGAV